MNKFLNLVKKNYWPIELKITAVVWIIKKFRHIIKSISQIMIIYIDHIINIFFIRQTSFMTNFTNKLNLCLIWISQYFSTFNISLKHKTEKNNIIFDAFSCLSKVKLDFVNNKNILKSFYDSFFKNCHVHTLNILVSIYYIEIFIEIFFNFKQNLMNSYINDFYWFEIFAVAKPKFKDFLNYDSCSKMISFITAL